ncbi:MAG: hypothetical protein AB1798_15080, partial [Spirochaetota bacterium]
GEIPLSIEYDSQELYLDRMEVELVSLDGQVLGSEVIGAQDLKEKVLPSLKLPALKTNLYTLRFKVYSGQELKLEKKIDFFYTTGEYTITGITSYPPVISPGSTAILHANCKYPEEADPYLRWSLGGEIIAEGTVSRQMDNLKWKAPPTEGVYSIKLELFPFAPSGGTIYSFSSSISLKTEVFVTKSPSAEKDELSPEDQYYSLFHFRGDFSDFGLRPNKKLPVAIGEPELSISGSLFGYYLNGSNGIEIPAVILPFKESRLEPFSLVMRMKPDGPQYNTVYFVTENERKSFSFMLSADEKGILQATLKNGLTELISTSGKDGLIPGEVQTLTLSVMVHASSIEFFWFLNGFLLKREEKQAILSGGHVSSGTTIIGGKNGFKGIIDELGIYFQDSQKRPSIAPDVFRRAMEEKYGTALVLAEGFDGLFPPDNIVTKGTVSIREGSLVIQPGSSIILPKMSFGYEDVVFDISGGSAAAAGTARIRVLSEDAFLPLVEMDFNGSLYLADGSEKKLKFDTPGIKFELLHDEKGLRLRCGTVEVPIDPGKKDIVEINIQISNPETNSEPVSIDSILIKTKSSRIVKDEAAAEKVKPPIHPPETVDQSQNQAFATVETL